MAFALGNIQKPLTEDIAAAIGGAAQRVAWDKGDLFGIAASGAALLAGAFGEMNTRTGTLLNDVSVGVGASGAAVLGWVGYEKMVLLPTKKSQGAQGRAQGALAQGRVAGLLSAASGYAEANANAYNPDFDKVKAW